MYRFSGSLRCGKREWAKATLARRLSADIMPLSNPWLATGLETLPAERLFAASKQPLIIVNATTGKIVDANPAATLLIHIGSSELVGKKFVSLFEGWSASEVLRGLAQSRALGHSDGLSLRTAHGTDVAAALTLVRAPSDSFVLIRLSEAVPLPLAADSAGSASIVFEAINTAPTAFLITDDDFKIDFANLAFIELVGAGSAGEVCGSSLLAWLPLTCADVARLARLLAQRQAADFFATVIRPVRGVSQRAELCAVPVPEGLYAHWGFTVRILPSLN